MATLTAIILTRNEAAHIVACIESLAWADAVVVFDSHSTDETVALATRAGATVYQRPFDNYASQRNAALDSVSAEWVFFVDADERGTPELGAEIRHVVTSRPEVAWYVPRHNYIFGQLTLGAGWYPDYQLRLLRHGAVRYSRPVHEIGEVDGEVGYLENPLIHLNYRDFDHFKQKQRFYVKTDARILKDEGIRPKLHNYILQPWRQFWWRYVTLDGYQDGLHGLRLSAAMAYFEWRKYQRLAELWANPEMTDEP
jgi:glycosyltransferase involved in cell wall biosynthesis